MAHPPSPDPGERDAAAADRPYVPHREHQVLLRRQWPLIATALRGASASGYEGEYVPGGMVLAGPLALAAYGLTGFGSNTVTLTTTRADGRAAAVAVEAALRGRHWVLRSPGVLLEWTRDTVAQWAVDLRVDDHAEARTGFLQIRQQQRTKAPRSFGSSSTEPHWQALHPDDAVATLMWNMVSRGSPEDYRYAGALLALRPTAHEVRGGVRLRWTWDELMRLTQDQHPGLSRSHFATAAARIQEVRDVDFTRSGIPAGDIGQLQRDFRQFAQHLRDDQAAGTPSRRLTGARRGGQRSVRGHQRDARG